MFHEFIQKLMEIKIKGLRILILKKNYSEFLALAPHNMAKKI